MEGGLFTLANIPHLYSGCQVFQELFFRISSKGSLQMLLCFFRRQKYNIEKAKSSVLKDYLGMFLQEIGKVEEEFLKLEEVLEET